MGSVSPFHGTAVWTFSRFLMAFVPKSVQPSWLEVCVWDAAPGPSSLKTANPAAPLFGSAVFTEACDAAVPLNCGAAADTRDAEAPSTDRTEPEAICCCCRSCCCSSMACCALGSSMRAWNASRRFFKRSRGWARRAMPRLYIESALGRLPDSSIHSSAWSGQHMLGAREAINAKRGRRTCCSALPAWPTPRRSSRA